MREKDAAEDDAGRVDQRREGLVGELLAHQSDRREHAAGEEEDLPG